MKKVQKTEEQKQIAAEAAKKAAEEKAKGEAAADDEDTSNKPSVFNSSGSTGENVNTASNGHVVCIDPGHQGEWVDMSATEPNGPGSSVPKAKCSTGTSGSYTGLNEYQLNLDVSLKLQQILIDRGYQVVMTRKIPVTIVEMGFMTHETDDRQMADPAFQETMAAGIADGIDAYFGLAQKHRWYYYEENI